MPSTSMSVGNLGLAEVVLPLCFIIPPEGKCLKPAVCPNSCVALYVSEKYMAPVNLLNPTSLFLTVQYVTLAPYKLGRIGGILM